MKKVISANNNNPTELNLGISPEMADDIFESIEIIMYDAGYDTSKEFINGDLILTTECREDAAYMPKVELKLEKVENNIYCTPTLTFPILTMTSDNYVDTIQHWLNKWSDVGRYMTRLCKYYFNIAQWDHSNKDE